MSKWYDKEFKKEFVEEYLKGSPFNALFIKYEILKSTLNDWVKKYSEECHYTKPHTTETNISAEEWMTLRRRIVSF